VEGPDSASTRRGPYAKTAQRRREIVEAATAVFAARGYHGGSLRDISRQIGLSLTSVVHHFPAKTDLLNAVLEFTDDVRRPWMEDIARRDGLKRMILAVVDVNFERAELLRLLAILSSEASSPDHPAHRWFVDRYGRLVEWLTNGIRRDAAAGRLAPVEDPQSVAAIIVAAWDGLQLQWLLDPTTDMHGRLGRLLDALLPEAGPDHR
jgi:AcrR family transcriptional regulator